MSGERSGAWEDAYGYSRVVVVGDHAFVAGTTATIDGDVVGVGDPLAQTLAAFGIALHALAQAGFGVGDVVRTRMYVTDIGHQAEVGRAHRELFGAVRPAATMVQVVALVHPEHLVEVELDAVRR